MKRIGQRSRKLASKFTSLPPARKHNRPTGATHHLLLAFAVLLTSGCTGDSTAENEPQKKEQTYRIVAVSYPLQFLTQRIAGDGIEVVFPSADADDPGTWRPPTATVLEMQEADLIVTNGAGANYAQWLVHFTLPDSKICKSVLDLPLTDFIQIQEHQIVHSHGPEGEHSHAYMVPFTWLDPNIAVRQAESICKRLETAYPDRTASFQSNLVALKKDLQPAIELAEKTKSQQNTSPLNAVLINPKMKHLTRAAGIEGQYLLYFDDDFDAVEALKRLKINHAQKPIDLFITDGSGDPEFTKEVEEIGIRTVEIDLLEKQPANGDYISGLMNNLQLLSK